MGSGPSSVNLNHPFVHHANAQYIDELYRSYQANPEGIDPSWRLFFEGYDLALKESSSAMPSEPTRRLEGYIDAVRKQGHWYADVNPLETLSTTPIALSPAQFGLGDLADAHEVSPHNMNFKGSFLQLKERLHASYFGKIGVDIESVKDQAALLWLYQRIEAERPPQTPEQKRSILTSLVWAESFERFLGDRFLGQKRFSLEGLDTLLPSLETLRNLSEALSVEELCIGMAHRGRLNVLSNFMGKPFAAMIKEFEGSDHLTHDIDGDVKYHMGYANYIGKTSPKKLKAFLLPNPSHLEAVSPVVLGFARARQEILKDEDCNKVVAILMHGDASFIGQGVIAETLNLSELEGYRVGGSIHLVLNNQVGFTTDPEDSRSCHYTTDIAKIVGAPVLHVNADDPEAVVLVTTIAFEYRMRFKKDVVIELLGYRRHGHNETDEPGFTQPEMYKKIKDHKTVMTRYSDAMVAMGQLSAKEFEVSLKETRQQLQSALDLVRSGNYEARPTQPEDLLKITTSFNKVAEEDLFQNVPTGVSKEQLLKLNQAINYTPDGFTPHPKVARLLKTRLSMMQEGSKIDWGLAEMLAFASLAFEGHHVRLSGQDCRRGTFSHRHAVIKDFETSRSLALLNQLSDAKATVEVLNSPLSEMAVMGYEFGYSVAHPTSLVLWEAQFGYFCNGAQIIIDQFLAASEAKWKQVSSLVLLLPHGYEGMGPEHSSARPERFLQLCGNNNMQVMNLTTPAQLFHALRRQVHRKFQKPLILLSPKSLLRHPEVVSSADELANQTFHEVLDDPKVESPSQVTRVVFCTGKIYYELQEAKAANQINRVALVRIEQLYPFPEDKVSAILNRYSNAQEVLWTQEEPSNMGYWTFIRHRLKRLALKNATFRYSGRKGAGTTAEGSLKNHQKEQLRILHDALGLLP